MLKKLSIWGWMTFILLSMGLPLSANATGWMHFARYVFQNGYWYQTGYYSIHFNSLPQASAATPRTLLSDFHAYYFPSPGLLAMPGNAFFQGLQSERIKKSRKEEESDQCANVPSLSTEGVSSIHVQVFEESRRITLEITDPQGQTTSINDHGSAMDLILVMYHRSIYSRPPSANRGEKDKELFQWVNSKVSSQTESKGLFADPVFGTSCEWQLHTYLNHETHTVGWQMISPQVPGIILLPVVLEPFAQAIPVENHPIVQGLGELGGSLDHPPVVTVFYPFPTTPTTQTVNIPPHYEVNPELQNQEGDTPVQPLTYENVQLEVATGDLSLSDDNGPPQSSEEMNEDIFQLMDIQFTDLETFFQTRNPGIVASQIRASLENADAHDRDQKLEQIGRYLLEGRSDKDPDASAKAYRLLQKALKGELPGFKLFGISVVPKTCKDGADHKDYRRYEDDDRDRNDRGGSFGQSSGANQGGYVHFYPSPNHSGQVGDNVGHSASSGRRTATAMFTAVPRNRSDWAGARGKLMDHWLETTIHQFSQMAVVPAGSSGALPSSTH
ncbi:hypothetical protein [Endozoicomonas arenosclerae]|uniref:hypothetical protein n=1 Tax=Endozoicomonas arenosclerae TaxID=1633495 RepID=UPI0012948624|nr:hypothetical protein [Endozoicomonas arenosclerae]